jgi:zinc protease
MKRFCQNICPGCVLFLILALPAGAADAKPTVDSVLAKFVDASGGKAAMEKIKSRTIRGDLDLLGSTSDWLSSAKAPNKLLSELKSDALGPVADGFDGVTAWSKTQAGLRVKEGEELAKMKRDADFYHLMNLKATYPDLAYQGTDKVDGEEVHVLESKPSATSKERFSFSPKSGLLIRQESEFEGSQGRLNLTVRLDDFRAVDGVKYPHSLKFKMSAGGQDFDFAIKVKEIKHNMAIDDAKFVKPAS